MSEKGLSLTSLNDNKAGMKGLDKEAINKTILEASKGSNFHNRQMERQRLLDVKIAKRREEMGELSEEVLEDAHLRTNELVLDMEYLRDLTRTIVHIDMDAFYAAVEMRDNPEFYKVPLAVGSESMLSTSNYLARRFGVRPGMPGFIARKLCSSLKIIPCNFQKYKKVSKEIQGILKIYDADFSSRGLDEAYLDLTGHLERRQNSPEEERTFTLLEHFVCRCIDKSSEDKETNDLGTVVDVNIIDYNEFYDPQFKCATCGRSIKAQTPGTQVSFGIDTDGAVAELRFRVEQKTRLTASAGVAPNLMLAKVTSDWGKPNGQYLLPFNKKDILNFVHDLPIRKVPGIGSVTENMLKGIYDIQTCAQILENKAKLFVMQSPLSFNFLLEMGLGISSNEVNSGKHEDKKSLSTEYTFQGTTEASLLYDIIDKLSYELSHDSQEQNLTGKTITLKFKTSTFLIKTRALTLNFSTNDYETISRTARSLLQLELKKHDKDKPLCLRLLGVRLSAFETSPATQTRLTSFSKASTSAAASVDNDNDIVNDEEDEDIFVDEERHEEKRTKEELRELLAKEFTICFEDKTKMKSKNSENTSKSIKRTFPSTTLRSSTNQISKAKKLKTKRSGGRNKSIPTKNTMNNYCIIPIDSDSE